MNNQLTRSLLYFTALTLPVVPFGPAINQANAELAVLNATGVEIKLFDFPSCNTTAHCAAHVPINSLGTAIFTLAAPGFVQIATGFVARGIS